jgi:hypothetical protein
MNEKSAPGRAAWSGTLHRIILLATELGSLLNSFEVTKFSPLLAGVLSDKGAESAMVLGRVVRLAQRDLDNVPAGGGQGGVGLALGHPSPQLQCAAAIAEVWERRGRKSSKDEDKAVACAALWRFADGPVTKKVDDGADPAEMWRRHLRHFAHKRKGSLTAEPVLKRRRRSEPRELGSAATQEAARELARERACRALDGPSVRN